MEILFTLINKDIALEHPLLLRPPNVHVVDECNLAAFYHYIQISVRLMDAPIAAPKVIFLNAIFQLYKLVSN